MKPTPCANPACTNVLSIAQLLCGTRHCCLTCANLMRRNPQSKRQIAQRLGITTRTLRRAIATGRFDGVQITPRPPIAALAAAGTVTARCAELGISRPTYYAALKQGRITDAGYVPAKRGRPRR